jgi:predicted transglutaminase-like cysteine proteinase
MDRFPLAEYMRQALKLVTIAAALVVTSMVSVFTVAGASILVVSPCLHDTGSNWSHPRESEALAKPLSFGMIATNVGSTPILHGFDDKIRVAFNALAEVPPHSFNPSASSLAIIHGPARPAEADGNRMTFNTPALAPLGFVRFCIRYPQDCAAATESIEPQSVPLNEVRQAELAMVNRDVNRSIKPSEKIIASPDEWLVSPREGKCTDYAITKRHELLALGWPGDSLLLAEVVIPSGEHHLVLVARTGENDLVLDNLDENIRPIAKIPYQWVRAQLPKNPRFWATIDVSGPVRMAMNAR